MKKTMIAVLLFISILQAGITFGTGSRVFIYDANISVYGNLKNLGGVITPVSTSKFTFVGSAQDTITNITTFPNLAISKPSGSVRLNNGSGSFTITGSISFTGGNVITGTNTFELGTTATVTGESTAGYIVGTVRAARSVGAGTNTFGGIGYSINNTGADLGTVTVYRYSGEGNQVTIYGSPGILRRWAIETSNPFSGTRQVTASWFSGEDNGNVLANLKAWKYVAAKVGTEKEDNFKNNIVKSLIKKNDKLLAKSNDRERADDFTRDFELEEDEYEIITEEQKTLGWVEIDGATFNTAGSPRTATFSMDAVTSFTINDTSNLFADGAGTASNPYQIATLDQLNAVRYYPSACFIQIADIDASATSTWNSGSGWEPLGSSGSQFTGNYNGQGYDITGLYINRSAATYVGLFGYANGATISNVELYSANVTGGSYTGGLIGYQTSSASVENCLSDGTVAGTNYVGGLVGYIRVGSSINNSLSKGQVSANTYIGGLIGRIYSDCDVMNSYSMADVIRNSGQTSVIVGGFIGQNYAGSIINSYSTGSVTYDATTNPTDKGFAGTIYNDGIYYSMTGNFWNTETSGQLTSVGATGLTKNQMRTLSTFTNATWDFQDESVNGVEDVWGINAVENSGYPFLSWEGITHNPSPFAGGIGTSDEPFLVSNLTQLDAVRNFLSYSFLQTADIDASETLTWNAGAGWLPIGTSSPYFTGTYDGDGNIISNLYCNRTSYYTGLFGVAYTGSVIKYLGLKDISINGYSYSGT
ncbi:MAG: GLUG motif-containing protein, partial [Candidatus Delongbacteria bacterium]